MSERRPVFLIFVRSGRHSVDPYAASKRPSKTANKKPGKKIPRRLLNPDRDEYHDLDPIDEEETRNKDDQEETDVNGQEEETDVNGGEAEIGVKGGESRNSDTSSESLIGKGNSSLTWQTLTPLLASEPIPVKKSVRGKAIQDLPTTVGNPEVTETVWFAVANQVSDNEMRCLIVSQEYSDEKAAFLVGAISRLKMFTVGMIGFISKFNWDPKRRIMSLKKESKVSIGGEVANFQQERFSDEIVRNAAAVLDAITNSSQLVFVKATEIPSIQDAMMVNYRGRILQNTAFPDKRIDLTMADDDTKKVRVVLWREVADGFAKTGLLTKGEWVEFQRLSKQSYNGMVSLQSNPFTKLQKYLVPPSHGENWSLQPIEDFTITITSVDEKESVVYAMCGNPTCKSGVFREFGTDGVRYRCKKSCTSEVYTGVETQLGFLLCVNCIVDVEGKPTEYDVSKKLFKQTAEKVGFPVPGQWINGPDEIEQEKEAIFDLWRPMYVAGLQKCDYVFKARVSSNSGPDIVEFISKE